MSCSQHLGATSTALCARYNVESEILWHSKEIQEISGKYHVMYEYVTKHAGMIVNDFKSALKVYDALAIEVSVLLWYKIFKITELIWSIFNLN